MAGGVNRFEKESAPTQAAEVLDVVNDGGNIRRRDGMSTFAAGAPHHLPAGATTVISAVGETSYVNLADRVSTDISGKNTFYVGCDEKFDGIDWPGSASLTVSIAAKKTHYIEAAYWDGDSWETLPFVLDTTKCTPPQTSSDGVFSQTNIADRACSFTLSQHGHISWHTVEHLTGWATTAVNSITKYYVRLTVKTVGATTTMLSGSKIDAPGVRVFKLAPVNGLFPVKLKDRAVLVIGTDRARRGGVTRRGVELGAQLGYHTNDQTKAETAILVLDEGAATIGTKTNTDWGGGDWPAALGTASVLEKRKKTFLDENLNELTYAWLASAVEPQQGQFLGSIVLQALVPTATPSTTTVKLNDSVSLAITDDFENCRLRVTTAGGSGPAAGEEREIVSYDGTNGYTVYPAFSAAPAAGDVFAIYTPHAHVRFDAPVVYTFGSGATATRNWEIASHDEHKITPVDGSSLGYAEDPDVTTFQMPNFEIGRELRWSTVGGKRWCGAYDSMTGRLILANGESPLLAYDGRRLRELVADDSSDAAKELAGQLPQEWWGSEYGEGTQLNNLMTANAIFRPAPPLGAYVVDYMGRLVVADPNTNIVAWSMPVLYNDIWPMHFEYQVRDDENNAITGMATLRDQLFVFTSSAIFASGPADARGNFGFHRASHGVGFVSHHAVERISISGSSTLIGAAADGVYMFNGNEPVPILEDWRRVLPDGVNRSAMDDACATVSLTDNKYYLAVPASGSDRNNRILVFDWMRKQWWVFSAPYGVASLATDYDENGNERVLIGTYDGHVAQFTKSGTDDGTAVTGVARSIAIAPLGAAGRESSFVALTLDMKNMGTNTVTVNTYTDRQQNSRESSSALSKTLKVDASLDVWGTGEWETAKWGDSRTKTVRLNMPTSARGHTIQYEISGSGSWELNSAVIFVRPLGARGRR